jgi:hypothetical protein
MQGRSVEEYRAPLFVAWQLTNRCGARCIACCEESGPDKAWSDELGREEALDLAQRIVAFGVPYVAFGGGEPPGRPHSAGGTVRAVLLPPLGQYHSRRLSKPTAAVIERYRRGIALAALARAHCVAGSRSTVATAANATSAVACARIEFRGRRRGHRVAIVSARCAGSRATTRVSSLTLRSSNIPTR